MALTRDIGTRIELVPMDSHCNDITVALYKQAPSDAPVYRIHTYSQHPDAQERIGSLSADMQVLGACNRPTTGFCVSPAVTLTSTPRAGCFSTPANAILPKGLRLIPSYSRQEERLRHCRRQSG